MPTFRLDDSSQAAPSEQGTEVLLRPASPASTFGTYRWAGRRALAETVVTNGLLLGLGAASGVLAARLLGPQGRGALALGIAVAGITTVVVGLGLQQAFAYLVAAQRQTAGMAMSLTLATGALTGALSVGVTWLLVLGLIHDQSVGAVLRIGILAVPGSVIAMNTTGILQGLRFGRRFNASRLLHPTAYCVGIVGVALVVDRVTPGMLAGVYAVAAGIGTVGAYWLLPASLRRPQLPSRSFTRSALRYGAAAVIGGTAVAASTQLAVPLVGALAGLRETGFYAVGLSYAIPVTFVASAIAIHALPDIAAADLTARTGLVRQRITITVGTLLPIAVAALLAAPLLVPAVFGEEFRPATATAQVFVVAQSFRAVAYVLADIARGLGRPGIPSIAEVAGTVATVVLSLVLIPGLGGKGAAIGVAIATAGVVLFTAFGVKRALRPLPPRFD